VTPSAGSPLISVILPTFNRRDFLRESLESVQDQSYSNLEVLVVDDGSTDDTGRMVKNSFPHVRYTWQENQGPAAARNRGVKMTRGDWIAFLDSDDLWKRKKLDKQMHFLLNTREYRACYTEEIWIRRGVRVNQKKIHRKYSGWIFPKTLPLCIISPSSIMMHRHLLEEVGLFDENLPVCEDYDLWIRLTARHPVHFLAEPLIIKRGGHPDQISNRSWGNDRYRVQALCKVLDNETDWYSMDQKKLAYGHLVKKSTVLIQGFRKREKIEEARTYENLIQHYSRYDE